MIRRDVAAELHHSPRPRSSPASPWLVATGDQPAATPAATMPAMTVGAPRAELDLDLDPDPGDLGADAASSCVHLCGVFGDGGGSRDPDLDLDTLRDRVAIIAAGCCTANFRLPSRPPFMRLRNLSSSRTSTSGSGYMLISSSDTLTPGLDARLLRNSGASAATQASGTNRSSTPTGIDRNPSTRAMPHRPGVCPSPAMEKAAPPKKTMMICAPLTRMLIPMKYGFCDSPSNMLSLLSRRRLLSP